MEVGPSDPEQAQRLAAIRPASDASPFAASAWIVDPAAGSIWTTAAWPDRAMRQFVEGLLGVWRERARPDVAIAPRTFPWLTAAILAALVAVFALEIVLAIGGWNDLLAPSVVTLAVLGGLSRNLVLEHGEWYRLFSAPFLHVDAGHLAMNAVSIAVAGLILEGLTGRAWFAAIYFVGAIGGSLLSLLLNPAGIVSVGASGAGMALFAAMLVVSLRFPAGALRNRLQANAAYVLIPSLLPLMSALKGTRVDYAAHFGGAIAGLAVALVALAAWRRTEPTPRLQAAAFVVAIAAVVPAAYAVVPIARIYPVYEFTAHLAPPDKFANQGTATVAQTAALAREFPRDPRTRFLHGRALAIAGETTKVEAEMRAALAEEALWTRTFPVDLNHRIRTLLSLVLIDDRRKEEAMEIARPVCAKPAVEQLRDALGRAGLCAG